MASSRRTQIMALREHLCYIAFVGHSHHSTAKGYSSFQKSTDTSRGEVCCVGNKESAALSEAQTGIMASNDSKTKEGERSLL